jgi:hypothetical protein
VTIKNPIKRLGFNESGPITSQHQQIQRKLPVDLLERLQFLDHQLQSILGKK